MRELEKGVLLDVNGFMSDPDIAALKGEHRGIYNLLLIKVFSAEPEHWPATGDEAAALVGLTPKRWKKYRAALWPLVMRRHNPLVRGACWRARDA
jgi:uncharacterized protein YdaU (DUF1376 family)